MKLSKDALLAEIDVQKKAAEKNLACENDPRIAVLYAERVRRLAVVRIKVKELVYESTDLVDPLHDEMVAALRGRP